MSDLNQPGYALSYNSQGQLDAITFHLEVRSIVSYAAPFDPATKQFKPQTETDRRIMELAQSQLDLGGIDFSDKPQPQPEPTPEPPPVREDYHGLFMALIDPARGGSLYNRVLGTAEVHHIVLANFVVFSAALTQTKNLMALMAAFYRLQNALASVGQGLSVEEEAIWNGLAEAHGFPELVIPMSSPLP
jgi:hypothetical protein